MQAITGVWNSSKVLRRSKATAWIRKRINRESLGKPHELILMFLFGLLNATPPRRIPSKWLARVATLHGTKVQIGLQMTCFHRRTRFKLRGRRVRSKIQLMQNIKLSRIPARVAAKLTIRIPELSSIGNTRTSVPAAFQFRRQPSKALWGFKKHCAA